MKIKLKIKKNIYCTKYIYIYIYYYIIIIMSTKFVIFTGYSFENDDVHLNDPKCNQS